MNDLISRQVAIDELFALYEYQRSFDPTEAADLVRQGIFLAERKIEKLPSAQQWIPCSERLPEGGRVVLVTEKGGFIRHCEYANYCDFQEFQTVEEGLTVHDVIAWMPLPEPYQEGEQDGRFN